MANILPRHGTVSDFRLRILRHSPREPVVILCIMRVMENGAAMTPADRRISDLIDKWLTSIDLHLQYVELSDSAYSRAQTWPKHDRPSRWVLEVARQKIVELKTHCETREAMGDGKFAESLELMAFLANLVGIQHIQRFIPLAEGGKEDKASATNIDGPTVIRPLHARTAPSHSEEATREMPQLKAAAAPRPIPAPVAPPAPRKEAARPAVQSAKKAATPSQSKADPVDAAAPGDIKAKIIADAVRLLKWGKPWHELAELIGRIADRPPVAEIRKVLRAHKAEIEGKA